jgi:hypothetical protein
MIEIFESRLRFLIRCSERERMLAATAHTDEAREIHYKLARIYERQAMKGER